MNTRLEDIQHHIDEGLKIPDNEPITRCYRIGKNNINVTFYFGTKTQKQVNKNVYEVIKRQVLIENGIY
ncbi:hypothetical protein LL033_17305 [Clostridium estertheticum]|uniref:hypothetical protein n=1 Tax=Clostridium estertheticum TaxID=238834 RepID=UPI001C0B9FB2|nr:hypothetical protein [Clostridium estertheticum]MBU3216673.1 hypothetical protein [Clostridium estertheticum]WAG54371.1 hypothetical protein LL033_17305 [Clostridium estertheticum]